MQRSRASILFGLLILIYVVPALIEFYTDWIWFVQVGYLEVVLRSITARLALGSIAFVLAFGFLAANFNLAKGSLRRREFRIMDEDGPRIVSVDLTRMKAFVYLGAGVLEQLGVVHAGRAGGHAGEAAEAKIHFIGECFCGLEFAIGDGAHERDTAARAVSLKLGLVVRRAGGQAHAAVHALLHD